MVEYNIVHFCKMCKIKYVTPRSESKKQFCDKCQIIVDKTERNF